MEPKIEILKEQYIQAIELYRHEDLLNWSKFNNMVYTAGGLWIVAGYAFEHSTDTESGMPQWVFFMSCFVGMMVAFAFAIAIRSGVKYMQHRKDRIVEIEQDFIKLGGRYVVHSDSVKDEGEKKAEKQGKGRSDIWSLDLKKSTTTLVLELAPWCLFGIWVITLVLGIIFMSGK